MTLLKKDFSDLKSVAKSTTRSAPLALLHIGLVFLSLQIAYHERNHVTLSIDTYLW